jgi:hypothetical protein
MYFDENAFAKRAIGIDPMTGIGILKDVRAANKPITVKTDERLIDPNTFKEVLPGQPKLSTFGELIAERDKLPPGDPRRVAYDNMITKESTHQPATTVNVNQQTESELTKVLASQRAASMEKMRAEAEQAAGQIDTAHNIYRALDKGAIAGHFGEKRLELARLGEELGFTGPDKLAQTQTLIKGLANLTLGSLANIRAQGGTFRLSKETIDLLQRATSGNFEMSPPELRQIAKLAEDSARYKIRVNARNTQLLGNVKGAGPVVPLYQVEEPPAYRPDLTSVVPGVKTPGALDLGFSYLDRVTRGGP